MSKKFYAKKLGPSNVFMLASLDMPGNEKVDVRKIEAEVDQFGDIVIGDFVESYRNLTRKSIMAYEWLTSFCRNADIVVKTDDDVVVNIFKLTQELESFSQHEVTSSNFWCAVHYNEETIKDPTSVFYASADDFPTGIIPDHCAGIGYVTPMGVIDRISDEISKSFLGRVCTHEDIFMTGVLRESINTQIKANTSLHFREYHQNNPINHIDKNFEWITYALEGMYGDEAECLLKVLQSDNKECLGKFREMFDTKIFYLLRSSEEFEEMYRKLWILLNTTYFK